MTYAPPAERNVGLVFQSYALFPHLTVFENVAFPLRIRRMAAAEISRKVEEALAQVHLGALKSRRPSQLSGGQQQRVAIARAIVFEPAVLLLDEPLAALDRKLREDVRIELRRLQRSLGITTVLVTHDQDEAMSMADRVAVMAEGRMQQIDPPQVAYRRPSNRFVANFLGIANLLEGELVADAQGHHIVLPGGELAACSLRAVAGIEAREVCGVLRPEQIVLGEAGPQSTLRARVEDVIFFGESVRYLLVSERGQKLVAHAANPRMTHARGSLVSVEWEPDDIWILRGDRSDRSGSIPEVVPSPATFSERYADVQTHH